MPTPTPQPPNILFILIDDLGWRDLTCYGSTFYETPNLDRLAHEGMLFTNAYSSCPLCSPTRASIMSGKYPARLGFTQIETKDEGKLAYVPFIHYLPLTEKSIATALREQGYQTWHIGKWHLGDEPFHPQHHGFDINIAGSEWGFQKTGYFGPLNMPYLQNGPPDEYLTDRLTNEAINLIKNRRGEGDKPFFLNLCHYGVHEPLEAPEHLIEKYRQKAKALKLDQTSPFVIGDYFPLLRKQDQRVVRRIFQSDPVYAAMIENLDTNIGRLLQALDDEGIRNNTLIVLTSDNGGLATTEAPKRNQTSAPTCNLPLSMGKGYSHEGGTRVCQIIRWPDVIAPNSRCDISTTSTDFYPTFLEAAGTPLNPAQRCDGVSLMPLLCGKNHLDRDAIFFHYPHYAPTGSTPASWLIAGDWKLIEQYETGIVELFNLRDDISETRNLAAVEPERVKQLLAKLHAWQRDVSAKIPQPNPNYEKLLKPRIPNNAHE